MKLLISFSSKANLNKNVATTYQLIESAIAVKIKYQQTFKGVQNPQVRKLYDQISAELEILESVQKSLNGDHSYLRIMSR